MTTRTRDTVYFTTNSHKFLRRNLLKKDSRGRWTHLFYTVMHPDNVVSAYESIQSKPGLMTPAITRETLSGLSKERLADISCALLKGTFQFSPMRRVFFPKPNSTDKRPITISSPVDRIVHRSVANVLEYICEHFFLPVSYGFRPSVGTSSFITEVKKWTGIKRIIHADVRKCFDNIEHSTLIRLLEKHISDPLFLELIIQFLATPILDNKGTNYMSTKKGIPQGSVFSPILMNLVLHELDTFALSVCEKRRLKYARYADDCTFGVRANSDCVARDTLSQFSQFLKTELGGLSFRVKIIKKVGCILGVNWVLPFLGEKGEGALKIEVPIHRVISRLTQRGFLRPTKHWVLVWGKNPEAISNRYKMVALGLLRYYGPLDCENIGKLICLIQRDLFHSLCQAIGMLTGILPLKVPERLQSAISIYLKGVNMTTISHIRRKTPDVTPGNETIPQKEECGSADGSKDGSDPSFNILKLHKIKGRIRSVLFYSCACRNCEEKNVQVFQVRKMTDYLKVLGGLVIRAKGRHFGGLPALRKVLTRKRIPLCPTHLSSLSIPKLLFVGHRELIEMLAGTRVRCVGRG
jgi:retron-type reverse transcriptase